MPVRPADAPLVSIITPVYNGEPHLVECVESVLAQRYQHWEYVIVDNASTDATSDIARRYAEKDERIRVHRNDVLVSAATNHNIALTKMSPESKYCKFVHADDWLFPDCLAQMVEVAEANPAVGVVGAYRLDDTQVNLGGLPYPSTVVSGREVCRATLLGKIYVFGSPTSVLMRADLVRGRPRVFDDTIFPRHWDSPACYEILRGSDFGFVHQVLTYTRRPPDSRTALSRRIGSYRADELVALTTYGPEFLGRTEYLGRYREQVRKYYRFLARNMLQRDEVFWNYHRKTCTTLGLPLSARRLLVARLAAVLDRFLLPARKLSKRVAAALAPTRWA